MRILAFLVVWGQKSGAVLPCVTASEIPLYPSTACTVSRDGCLVLELVPRHLRATNRVPHKRSMQQVQIDIKSN